MQSSRPGFGNLCPVASLNQNLQGMAGRTYFPRTDPVSAIYDVKTFEICGISIRLTPDFHSS